MRLEQVLLPSSLSSSSPRQLSPASELGPLEQMAKKTCTLILKVDLECSRCSKKIKKTLCKLQDRARIQSIAYDEENGTVTLSGPFDPDCLSKKLCCMAYKVIKDIQIKPPPPPPPQNQPDPPPTKQPDAPATAQDPKPKLDAPVDAQPPSSKPPDLVYLPVFPACFCRCSCSEAHHGCCCRCCSCGKMRSDPPPVYGGSYCQEIRIVFEQDPPNACIIM
ncbi:unnamed protein product [Musa acuminata subsp. burmannicoides]